MTQANALAGEVVSHGRDAIAHHDQLVVNDADRDQIHRHAQLPPRLLAAIFRALQLPLAKLPLRFVGRQAADQLVAAVNRPDRI